MRLYLQMWGTWLAAGVIFLLFIPSQSLGPRGAWLSGLFAETAPGKHLFLAVFLFVVFVGRTSNVWQRYRRTIRVKNPPFTLIDAAPAFVFGLTLPRLFSEFTVPRLEDLTATGTQQVLVWLVAGTGFVLTVAMRPERLAPKHPKPANDPLFDSPIFDESEDTLGRGSFVEDFHKQLLRFPDSESFIFALIGPWGMGKTSTLNLLRERLRNDDGIVLVDFNPWYFSSIESVLHRFYSEIATTINKKFFYPNLWSAARRYSRLLSPAIKQQYGIDFSLDDPGLDELKARIQDIIDRTERRVIILIDDVDRLQTDELLALFKTVRLAATFRKCIFVLSYDESQVTGRLKAAQIDSAFLSKVIQSPIQLPPVDRAQIDYFLLFSDAQRRSHLDMLLDTLVLDQKDRASFDENVVPLYSTHLRPFFATLRDAKRFLISFGTRLPVVRDEVHLLDFFLLEVLRVFANAVYEDIWRNRFYYIPAWGWGASMASPFGILGKKEAKYPKIREHVGALLEGNPRAQEIIQILRTVFFCEIEAAYGRESNHDAMAQVYRAQKRITHSDCFDKYFLLKTPEGTLSDASVEAEMRAWDQSPDPSTAIRASIDTHKKAATLGQFFDRVLVFVQQVADPVVEPLAHRLADKMDEFQWELGSPISSEGDKAFRLLTWLLNDRVPDSQKERLLEEVLGRMATIEVAIRLVAALASRDPVGLYALRQHADIGRLRAIIVERFQRDYVTSRVNIFDVNQDALYVLAQIGLYDEHSREVVRTYVEGLCSNNPRLVGRLVRGYTTIWGDERTDFRFQDLAAVYDPQRLAALARQAGKDAWTTPEEEKAVNLLLDQVRSKSA